MKTELLLVRHGQTESNKRGLLHGRTDVPLTALGRRQAELVARRLSRLCGLASLNSSPLKRARDTAAPISRNTGLPTRLIDHLAEFDFGDLEGLTFDQVQQQFPEVYLRMFDPQSREVPFPNGESPEMFHERVSAAVDRLIREYQGERIVIVAHGGVIGSTIAWLTNGDANDNLRYVVRNCSVTQVELGSHRSPAVLCLDDVDHLLELEAQEVAT